MDNQEHSDDFSVSRFSKQMVSGPPEIELWDMLSDVSFWVKDDLGRFVWVNATLADQARLPKSEVIGKRDVDCFLNELALNYMQDDLSILQGAGPIRNKPELVMTPEGGVEWRQTTKLPVYNQRGKVIGTTGISRKMAGNVPLPQEYAALTGIITYANENLSKQITVSSLAREAHLSVSTLERYFKNHLRLSPHDLLKKMRLNRAFQLLAYSTLNISEIASECGYESVSSFSRAFRQQAKVTPSEYRRRNRSGQREGNGS